MFVTVIMKLKLNLRAKNMMKINSSYRGQCTCMVYQTNSQFNLLENEQDKEKLDINKEFSLAQQFSSVSVPPVKLSGPIV